MGNDQTRLEFTDPETGEVFPINATSLVSNVRDVLMSRRKMQTQAKTWKDLTESEQKDEITTIQELSRALIAKVVEAVAERGMTCAHVEIAKFAVDVDKGEVVITSKGFASDEMLTDLAHAKGKVAKLTVVDAKQFNEKSTLMVPDKDQPSLLPDDDEPAPDLDADDVEQMAADMDDDLDQMDEPDDLHEVEASDGDGTVESPEDEPEVDDDQAVPDAPDDDGVTPIEHGQKQRLAGAGPDENPFDGGTAEFNEWAEGWAAADNDIKGLIDQGYKAGLAGKDKTSAKWKKGSDAERFWLEGWMNGAREAKAEDELSTDQDDLANDSVAQGHRAAERGEGRDQNPYAEGGAKHSFWNEGWDGYEQPQD